MFSGIGGFELGINNAHEELVSKLKFNSLLTKSKRSLGCGVQIPTEGSKNNNVRTKSKKLQREKLCDRKDGNKSNRTIRKQQHTCIGYSEIDKYAIQIYEKHFRHKNYGDCTKINARELPDFDLLVGGFPCQAFSIAGKRKGFNDTRGTLFFDIARILKHKRPRYFLLENVKGLLSHDSGKTFQTILGVLTDLGYGVEWQVLNSKNFGVPQNRERVFIIGHLRGGSRRKVFPIGETNEANIQQKQKLPEQSSNTLRTNYSSGYSNETYVSTNQPNTQKRRNKSNNTNSIRRTPYTNGMRIRRLTPIECERLQGFPDNWTEGISDTQRYKCLGNAVTVNVIQAIIKNLTN